MALLAWSYLARTLENILVLLVKLWERYRAIQAAL
jgi:hypothetical protein